MAFVSWLVMYAMQPLGLLSLRLSMLNRMLNRGPRSVTITFIHT
jgi:hypothetical protein